jgi:hypothetical protein
MQLWISFFTGQQDNADRVINPCEWHLVFRLALFEAELLDVFL